MKKIILSLFSVIFSVTAFSQGQWCGTDQLLENYFESNPSERIRFNAWQDSLSDGLLTKGLTNQKTITYTIPVVVHVIHYEGDGNISRAQIEDGIRVLNEDFQKLNADTSNTRNIFKSIAADVDIEFKLANKAPDSSCTTGIVRVNDFSTYDFSDDDKSISHWESDNYFNVWLVEDIREFGGAGNILGYAQFPFAFGGGTFNLDTYGIVVLNEEWGTIGTAVNSSIPGGRTATHEVGHCLNLFHTFQSGCGSFCTTSGDRVCDTPPTAQAANFDCDTLSNTCSNDNRGGSTSNSNPYSTNVVDQVENYMGYDDCQTLFTEGQKDRMHDAIATASHLRTLVSASNLRATGTNSGYIAKLCPPVAEMYISERIVCVGDSLSFSDDSYGDTLVDYKWIFPGATPYTSTLANPKVSYDTLGTHDVILIVSNSAGSDTLIVSDIVTATDSSEAIAAFNYTESFEGASTIGTDWKIFDPSKGEVWRRVRRAAPSAGTYCAYLNNFENDRGEIDHLISPLFDMTTVINPQVEFTVAHHDRTGRERENLEFEASIDCGNTWSQVDLLSSRDITSGSQSTSYFPSTSDWRTFTLNLNTAQKNSKELRFRFNFMSAGGNSIFIDDFKITGASSTVGLQGENQRVFEFNVYPNPSRGENIAVNISADKLTNNANLYLTDIMGRRIQNLYQGTLKVQDYTFYIDPSELSSGIYFVTIEREEGRLTKKLIIN